MISYSDRLNATGYSADMQRQFDRPLDVSTVFRCLEDFEAYVGKNNQYDNISRYPHTKVDGKDAISDEVKFIRGIAPYSYVGQVVGVLDETKNEAKAYIIKAVRSNTVSQGGTFPEGITNVKQCYTEVGAAVKVDSKTIKLVNGVLKIAGIDDVTLEQGKTYQPTLNSSGEIIWSEVSATTAEGVAQLVGALTTRVDILEGYVGVPEIIDPETKKVTQVATGLFAKVKKNEDKISVNTGNISKLDEKIGDNSSGLTKEVNSLKATVGSETSGLVKDVEALKTQVGSDTKDGSILKDIADLKKVDIAQEARIDGLENQHTAIGERIGAVEKRVTDAEGDIIDIQAAYIKNVTFDDSNDVLKVTTQDGVVHDINLNINKAVVNFTYNSESGKLELELVDGTVQEIPMGAFINDYKGSTGGEVTIAIDASNNISATINSVSGGKITDGTIAKAKLQTSLQTEIDKISPNAAAIVTINGEIAGLKSKDSTQDTAIENINKAIGDENSAGSIKYDIKSLTTETENIKKDITDNVKAGIEGISSELEITNQTVSNNYSDIDLLKSFTGMSSDYNLAGNLAEVLSQTYDKSVENEDKIAVLEDRPYFYENEIIKMARKDAGDADGETSLENIISDAISDATISSTQIDGKVSTATHADAADEAGKVKYALTFQNNAGDDISTFDGSSVVEIKPSTIGALTADDVGSLTIKVGDEEVGCSGTNDETIEFVGGNNIALTVVDDGDNDSHTKKVQINSTAVADRRVITPFGVILEREGGSFTGNGTAGSLPITGTSSKSFNIDASGDSILHIVEGTGSEGDLTTIRTVENTGDSITIEASYDTSAEKFDPSNSSDPKRLKRIFSVKDGGITTSKIADKAVKDAKIDTVSASKIVNTDKVRLVLNGGGAAR